MTFGDLVELEVVTAFEAHPAGSYRHAERHLASLAECLASRFDFQLMNQRDA